ncbi:helix-turn-helix transcriptional regulator [Pseudomonas mosselii]|uniref:PAS domain-containing protein n=1 Tax=Pseudomonas mosselii TaxID=78327 RepID=A0ABX9ATN1_9PSED|nr:PAS domain-containing protein [Pseudomonas mosselii]MBH3311991.1 PAS domain-containing protein [Pseudomonas mosselii]MBH3325994.1 PAS domain-containing protein [Pseudomonas mosselii]MCU9532309.1 PAS domain-containing protein [Pseudomonas mosselii]MCU9539598.1 PAS domain-containing protein [Pseudomonas mosselii]MCU9545415.1 PAS domain-containing protein [Pseudomonas mosselii]
MPSPTTQQERQLTLTVLQATLQALGSVVPRNVEILLHDLEHPEHSVVAIVNGHLSGRRVGSPILAAPEQDQGFKALMQASADQQGCAPVVLPDYPTTLKGRSLRSATAIFRDRDGLPFASLCVNTDVTGLEAAMAFLQHFQPLGTTPAPADEAADMTALMAGIIQDALQRSGQGRMNKQAKVEAVRLMQGRGLFIVKGGVEKAAEALGVTRYTVYNYLEQLRGEPATAARD